LTVMPGKINIGILGCAKIAERSILPALLELEDLYTISGIASRDIAKAEGISKAFRVKAFDGYDSILHDSAINAVYIPLPNALHGEWIRKSLEKGLHVLSEKSLGCNLNEVKALNCLAREKSLVLIENFQFRFHRQLALIMKLLNSGTIGNLRCMRSSFGFPPFPDSNNIRYMKELGGGALLDAGSYPIKASQIFLGSKISVQAAALSYDAARGIDIWGGAFLKQQEGEQFAEIAFGFDNFYQCNLELWGSSGKITANRIFTASPGFRPEILVETESGQEWIKVEEDNHFRNMLMFFHNCITQGVGIEEETEQNINQARLIEELRSKADGK
jgi:dTDP-3,4-didehydro-2,6-dideoxy-alpha-D-glucose 3-reductase